MSGSNSWLYEQNCNIWKEIDVTSGIYMYDIYYCLILLILPNICSFNMELSVNYCDDSFLTLQNLEREQDDGNQGKKYTSLPDSLKAFFLCEHYKIIQLYTTVGSFILRVLK